MPTKAEPPSVQLLTNAPGAITVYWQHPDDGTTSITLEREEPAFSLTFTSLVNYFTNFGLEPDHTYRYRVCANYNQLSDCSSWISARTFVAPPPYSPPEVPHFTGISASTTSITVNWTSSERYGFYQIRWAENGYRDSQVDEIRNQLSFTFNNLRPGADYHFIIQGCHSTLLGSSCSRFSAPITVSTAKPQIPQEPVVRGVIYTVTDNGDILWYRHDGLDDGSFTWAQGSGNKVGNGWNFKHIFANDDGVIYAIPEATVDLVTGKRSNSDLLWFRHIGWKTGNSQWTEGPRTIGSNWSFKQVIYGGNGVIYAIKENGDLHWYRHDGRSDGSYTWAEGSGRKIGNGWNFKQVFSIGNGIIYAIRENGDLLWFHHIAWHNGGTQWSEGPKIVGNGWNFKQVFSGGNGVIYAIPEPSIDLVTGQKKRSDLLWYRHDGRSDGSYKWAENSGKKVGKGWDFIQVFSPIN